MVHRLIRKAGEPDLENGPEPREAQQQSSAEGNPERSVQEVISALSLLPGVIPARVTFLVGACIHQS